MKRLNITENGFIANLFEAGSPPHKAIIILGGSDGGLPVLDEQDAQSFLKLGCSVICPAYFGIDGLPLSLNRIPLEYFEHIFDWLSVQPGIIPDQYAIMGTSKGGELALLLASRYPQIKSVIAVVPSHVVWQGIPKGLPKSFRRVSSWSYAGEELPFVPIPFSIALLWGALTFRYCKAYAQGLHKKQNIAKAIIPVEKISGPVLLISGKEDGVWPSTLMCEQVVNRLKANHFPFYYKHIAFDAGHWVRKTEGFESAVIDYLKEQFV